MCSGSCDLFKFSEISDNIVPFWYGAYSRGERLWIDSNGKMETRHPAGVGLSCVSEFSASVIIADRAQNLPRPATDNVLRVLQISSKSVHFRRSYSRAREYRQNVS